MKSIHSHPIHFLAAAALAGAGFLLSLPAGAQAQSMQPAAGAMVQPTMPGAVGMGSGALAMPATDPLPPEQMQGQVAFRTGGVGDDQDQAMRAVQAQYPLVLQFAGRHPQWGNVHLASVRVVLTDQQGRVVLSTVSDGPWLLAKLPPGRYTITAEHEGVSKTHSVQVPATGSRQVVVRWEDDS